MTAIILSLGLTLHATFVTGYVTSGITASGAHTAPGVAACAPWVSFGTRIWIDGIGVVDCEDRYGAGLSERIDVFVRTTKETYELTGYRDYAVLITGTYNEG